MEYPLYLAQLNAKPRTLVEKAALIAYAMHLDQVRKDDKSPYLIHPYMVAMKLTTYGFDETTRAAALVHDVLEDSAMTREELAEYLNEQIVTTVELLSENKALPWEERKERYIEAIRTAPVEVKAISIADKIHNLESLLSAYAVQGSEIWQVFNRGREAKTWFEKTILKMFQETWQHPLVEEYAALVAQLDALE